MTTMRSVAMAMVVMAMASGCKSGAREATAQPARQPTTVTVAAGGRAAVRVDGEGYHPATVRAPAGASITLVFTRTTDECCGQQLVFPSANIRRDLPLNTAVAVAVTVPARGALNFTCGMNMYQGNVVVQ